MTFLYRKIIALSILLAFIVMVKPDVALANQYGVLRVTRNTTLKEDQFGNIVIDANNVTLDCAGRQVHISSFTKSGCAGDPTASCAIEIPGNKSNVVVKNCKIVGSFTYGLHAWGTVGSAVTDTQVAGPQYGFMFKFNVRMAASRLVVNDSQFPFNVWMDSYGAYTGLDSGATPNEGVYAGGCDSTQFWGISSAYARKGVFSDNNLGVTFDQLEIEHATEAAFYDRESSYLTLRNAYFIYNENGVLLTGTNNSVIQGNQLFYNGQCDAQQDSACYANSWGDNYIMNPCAGVPNPH